MNRFEAQEIFLSPGNYANSIYYVQSGLVRGAIDGTHDKLTTWFKQEGAIIMPSGVFTQHPSEEYIGAVVKTTLLSLPVAHIHRVMTGNPEILELMLLLMAESTQTASYREQLLRIPAAKDRYDFLSRNENFILKRTPHYLIASYLNITKETFSRLHKGLDY
jgi:CRP-like cAMP-binding protein